MRHVLGATLTFSVAFFAGRSVERPLREASETATASPRIPRQGMMSVERKHSVQQFLHDLRKASAWAADRVHSRGIDLAKSAMQDISTVEERIEALGNPVLKAEACRAAGYNWPNEVFDAGEAWAMGMPTGHDRDMALGGLLARFHDFAEMGSDQWDAETVARLIRAQSSPRRYEGIAGMAHSIAQEDPLRATEYFAAYEDEIEPLLFKAKLYHLTAKWLHRSRQLPDKEEWKVAKSPVMREAITYQIAKANASIEELLEWVGEVPEERLRTGAAHRFALEAPLLAHDPKAAGRSIEAWAIAHESRVMRDAALTGLVLYEVEHGDVREGLRRAGLIGDAELRGYGLDRALSRWTATAEKMSEFPSGSEDATRRLLDEARAALKSLNLPPDVLDPLEKKYFENVP